MSVFPEFMSMYYKHAWRLQRLWESIRSPRNGAAKGFLPAVWVLGKEPASSRRTAGAVNLGSAPPAP